MTGALETILSRPRTVLTMMVVMVVAGILTYINIPKEANPDIDVPVYYVSITQQGVSPQDAERLLVRPMETELRGLEGLKEITAIASQGHAGIIVEFNIGTDKDKVLADIRDKVNIAQAELPQDAEEPAIFATNLALQPTIIVTLSGNVPERTMYNYIKKLQDEVEAISSVREANLRGTREEQFEVLLDLEKLESYDITQQELLNSISQFNSLVPAGFIDDGNARFKLEVPGLIENAQGILRWSMLLRSRLLQPPLRLLGIRLHSGIRIAMNIHLPQPKLSLCISRHRFPSDLGNPFGFTLMNQKIAAYPQRHDHHKGQDYDNGFLHGLNQLHFFI